MKNNIKIYKLKVIKSSEGSIIKFINKKSEYFMKFGEVYFSTVNYNTEKNGGIITKCILIYLF